jgi:biopolymer transport protein ExbD
MLKFSSENRTIDRMETAAFADIIFLLLIFFLLSSSFILRTEIPVTPPRSTTTVTADEEPVVVAVTRDGELFIDGDSITKDELATALAARLAGSPTKSVLVRGDEEVTLRALVEVMDAARETGAEKLAIATRPKGGRR